MESKPFWASKTLWANLIAGVVVIAGAFGLDLDMSPEVQTALVGGIMAIINIVLRFMTGKPIGTG